MRETLFVLFLLQKYEKRFNLRHSRIKYVTLHTKYSLKV